MASVWPAEGESFDPRRLRKAVSDAGFSAPEVSIEVAGTLVRRRDRLHLVMPDEGPSFELRRGERGSEIDPEAAVGRRARVTGQLLVSGADGPPVLTVERWQLVEPPTERRLEEDVPPADNGTAEAEAEGGIAKGRPRSAGLFLHKGTPVCRSIEGFFGDRLLERLSANDVAIE